MRKKPGGVWPWVLVQSPNSPALHSAWAGSNSFRLHQNGGDELIST